MEERDAADARFDRQFWDARWSEVLSDDRLHLDQRPPSPYLVSEVADVEPARALDAGCGHGREALWLAARGWSVTAVDFSSAALAHGRATADALGTEISERIEWIEADLGRWAPEPGAYDLVSSLYVHVAGSLEEMVHRLAAGVAFGGRLLLVGHLAVDPDTGAATRAAGQVQVTVEAATAALDSEDWEIRCAETRPRADGNGHDAVISAIRRA